MEILIDAPVLCACCKRELRSCVNEGVVYIEQCTGCGHYEDLIKKFCLQCVHRYSDQDCCNAFPERNYVRGSFLKCVSKYFKKKVIEKATVKSCG